MNGPPRKRAKHYARVHAGLGVSALHQWWIGYGLLRADQGDEWPGDGDPVRPSAAGHVAVFHARETAEPARGVATGVAGDRVPAGRVRTRVVPGDRLADGGPVRA